MSSVNFEKYIINNDLSKTDNISEEEKRRIYRKNEEDKSFNSYRFDPEKVNYSL